MAVWMNRWDIDDAVRQYGQRDDAVGEATRALQALMVATDVNSDGWPYYAAAGKAGARLMALIQRERDRERWRYERRGGETEPPAAVSKADLSAALRVVRGFRTRHQWQFDLTDAERAGTAVKATRKATAEREARVDALADRFTAELGEWDLEHMPAGGPAVRLLAHKLADMATPGTVQDWIAKRQAAPRARHVSQVQHGSMVAHDGYAPHSHEVRADHLGVREE